MDFVAACFVFAVFFGFLSAETPNDNKLDGNDFKWCGNKVSGTFYDDLGYYKEVDMCCREHYFSQEFCEGRATHYGLYNPDGYRRYSCETEGKFLQCLRDAKLPEANSVGNSYFNERPTKCFMQHPPIIRCSTYTTHNNNKKCILYEVDKSKPMTYQWFDVPDF